MPPPVFLLSERRVALCAMIAAALALIIAHGSEVWGGLVPCALCLVERWPWRIALAFGAAAFFLPPRVARLALALAAVSVVAAAAAAFTHVGVEAKWWPSPLPECAAPVITGGSIAERLAHMPALPAKPCDEPAYLLPFIPLSMAAMNFLFACTAAAFLSLFTFWKIRP